MSKSKPQIDTRPLDYWQLFQNLPESYILFEAKAPDYVIVEINKARERLLGVPRKQAVGRPLFAIHPPINHWYPGRQRQDVESYIHKAIRTGKTQVLDTLRYDIASPSGSSEARYWQSTYVPLSFGDEKITHILAATKEVTKEHNALGRMQRSEERLAAALAIGKVGSWVWDIETNTVVADANMARMFGVKPSDAAKGLSVKQFTGVLHPEDVDRVNAAIERAIKNHTLFEEEYRTTDQRGKLHWVIARARLVEQSGRRTFPGVLVDITERRKLQAQVELARQQDRLNQQAAKILQERNEVLEAISRTKDEFVALASHQLRTPATAVKQYIGMVLQGYVGEITELQTDMLTKAFESNERQIQIINQILNAARVDTGRLVMSTVPIDLGVLARGISDEMRPTIEQHGHSFEVVLPRTPVPVQADLGYLRMAIENLLHNAGNYTPNGGTVRLKLEKVGGKQARLSITDNGVGIRKTDQAKLFAKFSRIHNPLSVQAGGSGIGLFLTAEIVRLHGGSVSVESKINHGATFAILLPLGRSTGQTEQGA